MTRVRIAIALAAVLIAALLLRVALQEAGAEPAYRDYGRALAHYASVKRPNGVLRRLFVDPAALPALRDGFLPDRTLIAMEVFEGGDAPVRIEMKRWKDGGWLYGQHAPGDAAWSTGANQACEACHTKTPGQFEMFTFDSLRRFAREGVVDRFACAAADREPCAASLYRR